MSNVHGEPDSHSKAEDELAETESNKEEKHHDPEVKNLAQDLSHLNVSEGNKELGHDEESAEKEEIVKEKSESLRNQGEDDTPDNAENEDIKEGHVSKHVESHHEEGEKEEDADDSTESNQGLVHHGHGLEHHEHGVEHHEHGDEHHEHVVEHHEHGVEHHRHEVEHHRHEVGHHETETGHHVEHTHDTEHPPYSIEPTHHHSHRIDEELRPDSNYDAEGDTKYLEKNTKLLYNNLVESSYKKKSGYLLPFESNFKKEGILHDTIQQNYMNTGGDFSSQKTLEINENSITRDDFNWHSRSFQVSNNQIMFTGGSSSTKVFILNTETEEIKTLPDLIEGRDLHAMSWIDGKPGVIGGSDSFQSPLNSVEVFDNKHWKPVQSLHSARYGHSATFHYNKTWVFAGANGKNSPVNTIEYFDNNTWHSLPLKFEFNRVGAGLIAAKNKIFILGGFTYGKNNTASVLVFSIDDETVEDGKSLDEPASFSQNLWRFTDGSIESHGFRGKRITYKPE